MSRRDQAGVLGVFAYLDDAVRAAKGLKEKGLRVSALTPTYYEELEQVVDPTRSGVRWVTLVGALSGVIGGFALAIWTSLDWPLVTGGKEIVSLPPYLIIGFECMALLGALFNLVALLAFSGLPGFIRKEGYDRRFSEDRIGLWAPVPRESAELAASVMKTEGAEEVRIA